MAFALALFALSALGIAGLFALKYWELRRGVILAAHMRQKADAGALQLKALIAAAQADAGRLPPLFLHAAHVTLHTAAVDFGHFAHSLGALSHRLADFVSHRRHFEPRETRSEFLKRVSEHKSGSGNGEEGTTTV